jgi:hypothetical protein
MRRNGLIAIGVIVCIALLGGSSVAQGEVVYGESTLLPNPSAEIRSSEVRVTRPWVKVRVAWVLPEGCVCSGSIGIFGVPHHPGGGKVPQFSEFRDISLLGGEVRAVAIRLLPGLLTELSEGTAKHVMVRFAAYDDAAKIIRLVPG